MAPARKSIGKVASVGPLLSALVFIACGSPTPSNVAPTGDTSAVAASGSGITVDVLTTGAQWQGGFPGAVRITNTAFTSSIASFEVVFKLASGSVSGAAWNGTITGPDASGNYTAVNPAWLQYQPIKTGQSWDVGFNGAGAFTSSTIVSLKVNGAAITLGGTTDAPPTVTLASSAATVTAAGSITLTATASDDKGVSKVEFYEGTTLLVSDTTAPYTHSITFAAANNGTHTYTARAYDTINQTTTSTAVTVTVNIPTSTDTPPTVSLASSAATVTAAGAITLTATASDDKGVSKVEFYEGTTLLLSDATAPYTHSITFSATNNGTHTYTARAYDTINQTTTSAVVTVTVNIPTSTDTPPTVSLASSAATVTAASTITLTATASDDKGVSKVEFYEGTTLLGSDTTAPYTRAISFTSANNGAHTYTARAYDTINQTTNSSGVTVTVSIPTVDNPPTISLTSSTLSVTSATTITLTASATDDKGLSTIDFFEGTTLLGTAVASPATQTVSFTQANNGNHTYTARATDSANQTTTSAGVTVSVNIGGTSAGYEIDPPDVCYAQYWNQGCESGACGGRCQTANACSPPENPQKSTFPKTFACPRFIAFSEEMVAAAKADWGDSPPFVYGVVGHDADSGGLDTGTSTCCQCYQLVFDKPEGGSPQPPELPIPPPMIVQSFNTAAGGGKNFDIYMGAGGFGAFNACIPGTYTGTSTTTFNEFMYTAFPTEYPTTGGIKAINIPECKVNGTVTAASMQSTACQSKIASLCNNTAAGNAKMTATTKASCIQTNAYNAFYHQNWQVRVKRVECPTALTRVTGCRLASQGLPAANPNAKTPATADGTFRTGYTTTTMQDCCKPSCAWKDQVTGAGLQAVDKWTSFYSCDKNGDPITAK